MSVASTGAMRGEATAARLETCPLCRISFDPECGTCSPACPFAKSCSSLTCPSCGYSFPRVTGLAARVARVLEKLERRRGRSPVARTVVRNTLAHVRAGERVRVTGFAPEEGGRLSKLAAFGIVEGCELRLRQRHPAFIVEIGETTLALDSEVAALLQVDPLAA